MKMGKAVIIDISIREILIILRQYWKVLFIIAIVFALFCGGYGLKKARAELKAAEPITKEQQIKYEKDLKDYEVFQEAQEKQPKLIASRWSDLYEEQMEDPIYSINPYCCDYDQIVVVFENNGNHNDIIKNWITEADNVKLFGEHAEGLEKYKNTLICTGNNDGDTQTDAIDTIVQLIGVEGFDTTAAASYLAGFIKQKSISEGLDIAIISKAHYSGYNKYVQNYQRTGRDEIVSIYNAMNSISNIKNVLNEPAQPQADTPSGLKKIFKYAVAGLILGLILGAGLVLAMALRKGSVISRRQLEDFFDLPLLSDFSRRSESALEVLNANLDLMSGEKSRIMLIGDSEEETAAVASEFNVVGGREFMAGCNIIDDANSLEKLQDVNGIALCVHLGNSSLNNIQKVLLRAEKLGKPVLGYVLL